VEEILSRTSWPYSEDLVMRKNSFLLSSCVHTCNLLFRISLKLMRVQVESGYNKASSIVTCVTLRKVIVALLEPTIIASYLAMVKIFLNLRARVLNMLSP
jgi:hypothetical protein